MTEQRSHRATGGFDAAREDLDKKTEMRVHAPKIEAEANERKRGGKAEAEHGKECRCKKCMGGRAGRKRGGHVTGMGPENQATRMARAEGGATKKEPRHHRAKHVGEAPGEAAAMRADRKPRKDGGRTGSDTHPFTSARRGVTPAGRSEMTEMD